jgi:23S rRNA pseudouridine1911/1915/1917 synthase
VRLDARLRDLFVGASGRTVKHWLESGRVRVGGAIVRRGDVEVGPGDRVELGTPQASFPSLLSLVFEDEQILVVDKPAGLLTIATEHERERTAYRLLADYVGGHGNIPRTTRGGTPRLFIVHRLDRETSGLLVFAKSVAAKRRLQDQFEARSVDRRYVAVVEGAVREDEGVLRSRLREDRNLRVRTARGRSQGREAITRYRVRERGPAATLLELSLHTGRRGQIRAQLAELGHPVVGDRAFGAGQDPVRRVCLHAIRLGFVHPRGHQVAFDSPAPPSFAKLVYRFERAKEPGNPRRIH